MLFNKPTFRVRRAIVLLAIISLLSLGLLALDTALGRWGSWQTVDNETVPVYQATRLTGAPPMSLPGAEYMEFEPHGAIAEGAEVVARQQAHANAQRLRAQGLLVTPTITPTNPVTFIWPVRQAAGYDDFGFYAVTQLVDNDINSPDFILDYACGDRTWDITGYNHGGTDIVAWPFPWNQMEENAMEVVAAADGVIISKYADDPNDQSCNFLQDLTFGNYIAIAHADGSVSWYAHLKYGNMTPKIAGDSVTAGEYLGIVGSSGVSSGPHLHFEVRASSALLAPRLDPFAGVCNLLNPETGSLWVEQLPYFDSGINKLTVGASAPEFRPCPQTAIPHDDAYVNAGQLVYFSAYHRDLLQSQTTTYTVYQPDGAAYITWVWPAPWTPPGEPYDAYEARSWPKYIEPTVPIGPWTYAAEFSGRVYTHTFEMLPPPGDNKLYLSADIEGTVGGINFGPEDILVYDLNNETWDIFFDGSDVGVTANMDAFVRYGTYLIMSFSERTQLPGIFRFIEPEDLVTFRAATLGQDTSGRFAFYFDGSDVGLDTADENVDAIGFTPNNQFMMSFTGNYEVLDSNSNVITGTGSDVLIFNPTTWYGNTSGSWALYLAGSDLDLTEPSESIDGIWISQLDSEIYVSTSGPYAVPGVSGDDDDIIVCVLEEGSSCAWTTFFDGVSFGVDGLYLEPALDIETQP